jgi:phosphatidylinositol 4-kinase A
MLVQRLRGADPKIESALLVNLADLALIAEGEDFIDVAQTLSEISRSSTGDDQTVMDNAVSRETHLDPVQRHLTPNPFFLYRF